MAKRREKGDGSIYQRSSDDMYVAYARVENGKKKYVYAKTRREVVSKLKEVQRKIDQGTLITAKQETVEAYLSYWLDIHKAQIRENTIISYKRCIKLACAHIGHIKLQKLAGDHLQKMYTQLQEDHATGTIRLTHTVLSTAFKEAVQWKRLSHNPCNDARPPHVEKEEMHALTPLQAQQLLVTAKGHPLECFLILALATAMRKGELQGLHWSDIDMEAKTLTVQRTASYLPDEDGKYGYVETSPKTKTSRRTITLAQFALDALKAHRTRQLAQRLQAGPAWQEMNLVFCTHIGKHYNGYTLRDQFNQLLKEAGLPHIRIHDLRHSAVTFLLKMKVPVKVVQEILGHSSIVITMDIYGHVLPGMQDDAMGDMDRLLGQS